jgi:hypothetical protein
MNKRRSCRTVLAKHRADGGEGQQVSMKYSGGPSDRQAGHDGREQRDQHRGKSK